MSEINDVYRKLQQHIDEQMPIGYPSTESGAEIRILKHLFTPEEAKLALNLRGSLEPLKEICERVKESGISIRELEEKLDVLDEKGAISRRISRNGEKKYCNEQFAIGFYENQVNKLTKELVEDSFQFMHEAFYKEFHRTDTPPQVRPIPVEQSITPEHHISNYDSIRQIIENNPGPFSVINCICKQAMDLLDQPCNLTDNYEVCMQLGRSAEGVIKSGLGRELKREEMFELLQKIQDMGLILQPQNTQNPDYICACCGDCCGVLIMLKKFPRPAELCSSNYHAVINSDECAGCETCIDRCQMQALSIVDNVSTVNLDRCIGCGNCVPTCPSEAIRLQKKEKETEPPKDRRVLYQEIMVKKKG